MTSKLPQKSMEELAKNYGIDNENILVRDDQASEHIARRLNSMAS